MSRRSSGDSTESLELLLDTICNTFGAVIFISMLVALLVSNSRPESTPTESITDPAIETAAVQAEIQSAREAVRVLSGQLRQQKKITDQFATEESLELAGLITQQTEDRVRLMTQKAEAVQELADVSGNVAVLQQKIQQQNAAIAAARAENSRLKDEVENQVELSGRTARIPQVRRTQKTSIVYAIDDGRLYRVTTDLQTIDTTDCVRSTEQQREVIRPRPGGGMTVSSDQPIRLIEQRFSGITPKSHFIQMFVARDSFAEFLPVKDALVNLALEYEVVITEDDHVELFLGASQRESFVQ